MRSRSRHGLGIGLVLTGSLIAAGCVVADPHVPPRTASPDRAPPPVSSLAAEATPSEPEPWSRLGLRGAEQDLLHAEIAGEDAPVRLGQPPRRAALDKLLDVSGIAAKQPGEPGIILAPFLDQARQRHPAVGLGHGCNIEIGFFLDK